MNTKTTVALIAAFTIPASLIWIETRSGPVPLQPASALIVAAPQPVKLPENPAMAIIPAQTVPIDTVAPNGTIKHVAQPGDTVTSLATDVLGKDSKANRDAIIDANASLQADPDKLLAGKVYKIPTVTEVPAGHVVQTDSAPPVAASLRQVVQAGPAPAGNDLRYTAKTGDTVSTLAGALLGSSDQAHQDMILNANPSLHADPDKVIAGTTYRIQAPDGLSASASSSPTEVVPRPKTQPDSDQIVAEAAPRVLRYTAKDGDSVTTLAIALLGSDTPAARDAIINNNPSLKQNPDRLIAGQTYWIPAPTAPAQSR